jgi:Stress responsive A/B Barrel Domain
VLRHIVLFRVRETATAEQLEEIKSQLAGLTCPGRTSFTMGVDLGLRPGNMNLALVADFTDVDAFRAYDADPDHDRIRRELVAPVAEHIERCQFKL